MTLNHAAIRRVYPQAVVIDDSRGAFDEQGNQIQLDQAKVDAAAVIVAQEQALESARTARAAAFAAEADPLFFKAQRGEATTEEWESKVSEIRARFPYPTEVES